LLLNDNEDFRTAFLSSIHVCLSQQSGDFYTTGASVLSLFEVLIFLKAVESG